MTKKIKIIFIPGTGGGLTTENWFPFLERGLEALGCEVVAEIFPDPALARAKYWLPFIEKIGTDENTILVGHSSGAVAAMRYAEHHKILGSVLVSGCYTDLGLETERVSGYYDDPWQWEDIKKNQKWILQFHSSTDPFIPIEEARFIHEKLGSDYYELENRGHFYPMEEFPELLEAIKKHL